ncbi:protein-l-isoaspartate o-methyltransferase [Stemphylium lycopersici]|uniref:Protein-L-isoaspartate O-methyltransferase n=1 Tax=Stemphylium lycopersici TaxID=183478 RepID=A0A364N2Y9_STELY|nr:protein-l-isoaspartate o-methyltransferase [Stemphylium lycopersici]RAR07253.1 protein-l-isoaspartate o-methyltransferase [Stemphylium lycopersici]RAR10575.1 protein-l-isoaspartate o-methyltransferase [Stemphylium lycopersici]
MAWQSSGDTNEALIINLARNKLIKSDRVKEAMLKVRGPTIRDASRTDEWSQVDRGDYAPASPYEDSPQPIGHRATISAPHMHASACESLLDYLQPGSKVLDVGSGSGYLTAVLANLVAPNGTVIGIDHIQALNDMAKENMAKSEHGRKMMESGQVKFVTGDGRKGWSEGAPYDAIHVGAAAAEHHAVLTDQLKAPGRLFVPVAEGFTQHIYVIDKRADGSVERQKLYGVQYVPLTDAPA